ncbi:MAG: branched-chain amino acid ABC transporter permease [candidate division NC10 bacterium]|nr:branched-chain amino acid ABC transporter permease [candidate division NC10 bacterium]
MKNRPWVRPLFFALLLYLAIQGLVRYEVINPYWHQVTQYSLIVTISSLGLNIIYGYTGQFSLGHAAFFGIGAYSSALLVKTLKMESPVIFVLCLLLGALLAGLVAFLVGLPILRLRSDYLGIATLGFGIIVKVALDNLDGLIPMMGGSRGMSGIPKLTNFTLIYLFALLAVILLRNFIDSSHGRACISIREDEIAAETMGINTTKYKTIAFVMGCCYAGLAGGLYAHLYVFLHPSNFDFLKSFDPLLIVVLGGLGSMSGTIIAAIGWTFLLEGLRVLLPPQILDWRMVIYPVLLIVVMLLRPQGLFGGSEFAFLRPRRGIPE